MFDIVSVNGFPLEAPTGLFCLTFAALGGNAKLADCFANKESIFSLIRPLREVEQCCFINYYVVSESDLGIPS